MQRDPYSVLGLSNDATREQIDEAYYSLKSDCEAKLFEEGKVGTDASRKLAEIELAYSDCLEDLDKRISFDSFGSNYGEVEQLIKDSRIDEAQRKLDTIEPRDAEWHYMQSVIYYKRNWHIESKKQLEIAVALDPDNAKYKRSLDKMTAQMNGAQGGGDARSSEQQTVRGGYTQPNSAEASSMACCNTCSTLICCDCLCECCGGDLIPCC